MILASQLRCQCLAECTVTTPACHGQYSRIREEDRIAGWSALSWPGLWAPFDEDGQYCECRTDRMMNQHSLDEVIHPQHTYDGRVSGIPLIPKYIVNTLLKETLGGTALATPKQELPYLMETSASQQKMPVPSGYVIGGGELGASLSYTLGRKLPPTPGNAMYSS